MRILVTDRFSREGVDQLKAAGLEVFEAPPAERRGDPPRTGSVPQLSELVADAQGLVVRSQTQVTAQLLEGAKQLLVVGRAGVGCENIDVAACERLGILVMNTPGSSAITTGERTVAMMLAMLHQVTAADRSVRAGKWERRSFMASEAFDKTLGVLGYGNVGRVVVDRARALRMRVNVHDPNVPPEAIFNLGLKPVGFDELFKASDVVSVHVTADLKLKHLVGARELALMRPGSWLVNTSRGWVVDEAAVADALESKHLRGAAFDVFESEPLPAESRLRGFESVVLSPHLGASSTEAERRVAIALADQIVRVLQTGVVSASSLVARPGKSRHPFTEVR